MASGGSDLDAKDALSKLLQMGTVEDYQREFEKLMNKVTNIPDSLLISFYISGLKLHLQRELLASKPLTLGYVFLLACMIEACLEDSRSTTTIAKPNDLVQVQHLEETTFHKSNKVEETEARVVAIVHREKATTNLPKGGNSHSAYSLYHLEDKVNFEGVGNVTPWAVEVGRRKIVKCYVQGSGRPKRKKVIGQGSRRRFVMGWDNHHTYLLSRICV
ncbi:hypothetical protein Tco_1011386 [Tanacetum coccineum]